MVVIGGGAYYAWGEYQSHLRQNNANLKHRSQMEALQKTALEEQRLSKSECIRMAKETLPLKKGEPVRTTAYNADLSLCDDLGRFDGTWRQALDMAGVF
jgi:hypothetical protein